MKKLEQKIAKRIEVALLRFAESGHGDVIKLTDFDPPEWRLRVGDHRVFFRRSADTLSVLRVRRRDQAY